MAIAEIIAGAIKGINGMAVDWANYANQKSLQSYQKRLQQKIFDREDSAWQRAVTDIKKAGLSTTMLSGGAGSGATVNTSAPQLSGSGMGAILDGISQVQSMKQTVEQTKLIKEQQDVARAQKEKLDNEIRIADNADRRADSALANTVANTQSEIANREGRLLLDTDNSKYNNALVSANTKSRLISNSADAINLADMQMYHDSGNIQPKNMYNFGSSFMNTAGWIGSTIQNMWYNRKRKK